MAVKKGDIVFLYQSQKLCQLLQATTTTLLSWLKRAVYMSVTHEQDVRLNNEVEIILGLSLRGIRLKKKFKYKCTA